MNTGEKIWKWFNGKKSVFGRLISLVVGFLQAKMVIDSTTAMFLLSIGGAILGIGIGHKIVKR